VRWYGEIQPAHGYENNTSRSAFAAPGDGDAVKLNLNFANSEIFFNFSCYE